MTTKQPEALYDAVSNQSLPGLTIVIPVRNEADAVGPLAAEIRSACADRFDYRVLFVDDGSVDETPTCLAAAREADARVHYIRFRSGRGQSEALAAGFRRVTSEYTAIMDGDGQNDPADLPRLFEALNQSGADLACGIRQNRRDSGWRRTVSRIANRVRNRLTRETVTDVGCSIRVFRTECLDRITLFHGLHRFFPTLFRMAGYRFVEIPVNHRARETGRSKYGTWDRFKEGAADIFGVRWMLSRRVRYTIVESTIADDLRLPDRFGYAVGSDETDDIL